MADKLYVVVPCYNETEVISETSKQLLAKLSSLVEAGKISDESKIMFVDDGSKDDTWSKIQVLCEQKQFAGVKLSRNRGHQNAVVAGITAAVKYADVIITIDADLQDDIDAIDEFLSEYDSGCDVVYGVRDNRENDTMFKRSTAKKFYKIMSRLGVDVVYNHADYRLMSKRVCENLLKYKEVNLFLRGIVPLIGFKSSVVTYKRGLRFAGESKYPLKKMISFAIDGITSFSVKPLRLSVTLGIISLIAAAVLIVYTIVLAVTGGAGVMSFAILSSIWVLAGAVLLSLGIVGEYIGKIYMESKERPRFIIEKEL